MKLAGLKCPSMLIVLFCGIPLAYAAAADSPADKRFADVTAHIKANPIDELPIGTHPKKPKQVFSRLFNISLSARAYFQLHTAPSLDASSAQMLEKISQYYLDHPDQISNPDSSYWAGEYHAGALAKFGINGTERKGAIDRKSERVVLDYMMAYVNFWSRPARYDFSLKHDTYFYWASENHWWQEIVTAWGYLLVLKNDPDYGDRKLKDGKSVEEHYAINSAYMKQHMQQRARKGFLLEISSGGYSTRMHNMWHMIYDLSPDENMRNLARNTLDLWWAFWAEEQVSGERGGGKVRHRQLKGLSTNSETHMIPAWIYFGVGSYDLDEIRNIKPDTTRLAIHYITLFSGYLPDKVVYKIIEDRQSAPPYAITQRRLGKSILDRTKFPPSWTEKAHRYDQNEGDCLKYSWVTPDFVLGTVMRPPRPVTHWAKGSAQSWWHGLLISGDASDDPPERVVPAVIYKGDSSGEQYAIQSEGSFMTRKLPGNTGKKSNDAFPFGIYLSRSLMKLTDARGEFLFINHPRCWVAVRAVDSQFKQADDALSPSRQKKGSFFGMDDDSQPVIIETAVPGSFKTFEAFRDAARQARLVSRKGKHAYTALSGDVFVMKDDRSNPTINGKEIDYHPDTAYQSRYIHSKWDSGTVLISADWGAEKTLHFMAE